MLNCRVAVLAAGKGTRMKQEFPKALTPVGGKPILEYLIQSIEDSKVDGVPIVVTGPEQTKFCDFFNKECEYAIQEKQLGTGHATKMTRDLVGDAEALIVLYGDHPFISAESLRSLLKRHEERKNIITMMTTKVPSFSGWYSSFEHWGRILRGENGYITGIREFKDATEEDRQIKEVNPALFCFNTKWLWQNIEKIKANNVQEEFYLTDLVALAVSQGEKISALEIKPEEAIGINSPEELAVAEKVLKEKNA